MGISDLVTRRDSHRFASVETTPQGGLSILANVTRTGVLVYYRADGTKVRELRHPDDVFDSASLATLRGAPITHLHPDTPVRPSNWREYTIGHLSDDVKADGKFVTAKARMQDAEAIARVLREDSDPEALREASCGYTTKLVYGSGVFEGEAYDARQTDIRYNHVAFGPINWGRAGNETALRLDAKGNQTNQKVEMKTIRIDGRDFEIGSDEHIAKIDSLANDRVTKAEKRAESAIARADAAEKTAAELQGKLDSALDPASLDARVAARAKLVGDCELLTGVQARVDGMSDRQIKVAALQAQDDTFRADGKSDEYVDAYFESRVKSTPKLTGAEKARAAAVGRADAANPFAKKMKGKDGDEDEDEDEDKEDRADAAAARLRMIKRQRDAYKQ